MDLTHKLMSEAATEGVVVKAVAQFDSKQTEQSNTQYLFIYRIVIENTREDDIQLLRRYWRIIDANGLEREVIGDGVIGQFPIFKPGQKIFYDSQCPLETEWGSMEGFYTMKKISDNSEFDVKIARFYLTTSEKETIYAGSAN
jgi:ApaG protein